MLAIINRQGSYSEISAKSGSNMSSNQAHDESFSRESFTTEKNRTYRSSSCEAKKTPQHVLVRYVSTLHHDFGVRVKKIKNNFSTSILLMVEKHKLVHVIIHHKNPTPCPYFFFFLLFSFFFFSFISPHKKCKIFVISMSNVYINVPKADFPKKWKFLFFPF